MARPPCSRRPVAAIVCDLRVDLESDGGEGVGSERCARLEDGQGVEAWVPEEMICEKQYCWR